MDNDIVTFINFSCLNPNINEVVEEISNHFGITLNYSVGDFKGEHYLGSEGKPFLIDVLYNYNEWDEDYLEQDFKEYPIIIHIILYNGYKEHLVRSLNSDNFLLIKEKVIVIPIQNN
jgi:hypothetical protein